MNHYHFTFVGREAYEAAGGVVREDLFSAQDGDGTADKVLVDRLVQEKLAATALALQQEEGWSWSQVRDSALCNYGEDRKMFGLLPEPAAQYTDEELQRLEDLNAQLEATETYDDEAEFQQQIDDIEAAAGNRGWTAEQKASSGVVVSLYCGGLCIQRGVYQRTEGENETHNDNKKAMTREREPDVAEGISAPLLTKMSSERTLAVQAALVQQPQKAVALLAWQLCTRVFDHGNTIRHPFVMRLEVHHSSLTREAPTGEEGAGWLSLMQEKARLEALLPEGWKQDFTTFFTLDAPTLMSLLTFCTACSVDGTQTRTMGHTTVSDLDCLETAIDFRLRDWWVPTSANFLSMLSKRQITDALTQAGLTGAAQDAEKMKKVDAAAHAEFHLARSAWVPSWMQPASAEKEAALAPESVTETADNQQDTRSDTDPAEAA